jgi:uracil-DNA glycosylase
VGDSLELIGADVRACRLCKLCETRTRAVPGEGSPKAEIMFIGEGPGFNEDQQGRPFVGAAGQLLTKLLAEIGIAREDVYINNVLMCRPPGNRDPQPDEIQSCEPHLWKKIELIQPKLICTLGNFATKLLSGRPAGITQVHGRPQDVALGGNPVTLYPIFHPAAALYTPRMLAVLKEDFARIPELLGRAAAPPPEPEPAPRAAMPQPEQLGLF